MATIKVPNMTCADRAVLRAKCVSDLVVRGSLKDVRFCRDGTISPFIEISSRTHIADDHKWSFPFISNAARDGLVKPEAVMTLWEKHAREDFGGISKFPEAPKPGEGHLSDFKFTVEHLSRVTYNAALIASGLVSELIVVYALPEVMYPLFNVKYGPSITIPYYLSEIIHPETGEPFWMLEEHSFGLFYTEVPIHFCIPPAYPMTLRAVLEKRPERSLVNNFDLDLFTANTMPLELLRPMLDNYPRIKQAADEVRQADYNVVCTSTEIFSRGSSPDNTPELANVILETVIPSLV